MGIYLIAGKNIFICITLELVIYLLRITYNRLEKKQLRK